MRTFLIYVLWAAIQQSLALLPIYFFIENEVFQISLSIFIFSVFFHLGNIKLILLTGLLACCLYPFFFLISPLFMALIVIIHAAAGTYLKSINFELRVWRFINLEKLLFWRD